MEGGEYMEGMKKLHIEIDIENIAPTIETHFAHLKTHVLLKGDCPPEWLAMAIIYLCKSCEKEMRKRKAIEVTSIEDEAF